MPDDGVLSASPKEERTPLEHFPRLFFRPKSFFTDLVMPKGHAWLFAFAFTHGGALLITRALASAYEKNPSNRAGDWGSYWFGLCAIAILMSLLVYGIGGAWYGRRLSWCGVRGAHPSMVRLVYLTAAQVIVIPSFAVSVVATLVFRNPGSAAKGIPGWAALAPLAFAVWSYYVSYTGVRVVFKAPRASAAVWFLILPTVFLAGTVLLSRLPTLSPGSLGLAADIDHPREFANEAMSFSYPGNWRIKDEDKASEPGSAVTVTSFRAAARLSFFKLQGSPEAHLASGIASIRRRHPSAKEAGTCEEWGSFKGVGQTMEYNLPAGILGTSPLYYHRIFIAPISQDLYLIASEVATVGDEKNARAGFDLIRKTFKRVQR